MIEEIPEWVTDPAGPLGPDVLIVAGQRLRRWGPSEVWRVQLGGAVPRSVIVKRGAGWMAGEGERYRELVAPLGIEAPRLLAVTGGTGAEPVVLVLEDVGPDTLEQRPTATGYRGAVQALARMRTTAADRLAVDPSIGAGLRGTTAGFVDTARRAAAGLALLRPDLTGCLEDPVRALVRRLDRLDGEPATIVHGDFHAKNLIHGGGGRMIAVDWPAAYLHAHLGDLYTLAREAGKRGLDHIDLPAVYARTAGVEPASVADRMVTGGLCWTLIVLSWLVTEGVQAVPESRGWFDELVADARALASAD